MPRERSATRAGYSLVEIMLAGAIFALAVTALSGALVYGEQSTSLAGARSRAVFFAEEGLEAVRNIRDAGFVNLVNGTYGPTISSNEWALSGSSATSDIFTRQVAITTVDAATKNVTSTVTWQQNPQRTGSVTLTTRLTDWIVTTVIGNWALPVTIGAFDATGNQDGLGVAFSGNYLYMIRNSTTSNLLVFDLTNLASPLVATISLPGGTPSDIQVSGNYLYISSNDDTRELQIVNISTPTAPTLAGTYNDTGTDNANGVYVIGTTVYMAFAAGDDFVIVNASNPAAPVRVGASTAPPGAIQDVYVSGTFAYLVSTTNGGELQVVDISTPAAPTLTTTFNLTSNNDGLSITGFGNTILVGRAGTSGIAIIDITTPATPTVLSTYASGGAVNDMALGNSNQYVWVATSTATREFQVVDISTLTAPVQLGFVDVLGPLTGIVYHDLMDMAFASSSVDTAEAIGFQPS